MAKVRVSNTSDSSPKSKPPLTPEADLAEMVSLATTLLKQRLRDGTASSQEVTSVLKYASPKLELEVEKLRRENELLTAKTEALESQQRTEELFENAINAMKRYSGHGDDND